MRALNILKEHYASLTDDELRDIATTTELEPEARGVLEQELRRRDIHDLDQYQYQMQCGAAARLQQERDRLEARDKRLRLYGRVGYALCAVVAVIGAAQYLVGGDAKGGLATMAVAVVCVPVVWLNVWIRRMFVRMMRWGWSRSHRRPTIQSSGSSSPMRLRTPDSRCLP